MSPTLRLRKARPEEAPFLTELALRSKRAWGYDDEFMKHVMPDMIVRVEFLALEHGIVAEREGSVVGYAIVRVDGNSAFLRDLFVEPNSFRTGVGKTLFLEAARFAKERGATRMTLEGDPHAVGFYERLGMRQIGEEPSIVGGGRMLPVMGLSLICGPSTGSG